MTLLRRSVLSATAVCLLGTTIPPSAFATPAHGAATGARLISTEEVLADAPAHVSQQRGAVHAKVDALLARAEVRTALTAHGVDTTQVQSRVAALTDDEARQLAAELDRLPAGGDVLGYVFLVFVILLITDILGFTKVFPFTRPAK